MDNIKRHFSSVFSNDLYNFIEFRKAQGYDINNTEKYLVRFDHYCCENPPAETALTKSIIDKWIRHDIDCGYKDMGGRGRAIRTFGQYLRGMGKDAYIVPLCLFTNGGKTFTPYILSSKETTAFFDATDTIEPWHVSDKFAPVVAPVIFRLMYTSGLRPQEACALKDQDINFQNGEIIIRVNKRKKERIIVVSDDMLRLLNEYVCQREKIFVRTSFLFPRIDGNQYTSQQLRVLCNKCWIKANPDKSPTELPRLRPYDFRHAFATTVLQNWLDEGKDLYAMLPYLRAYMGHDHMADTEYYIHILPDRLLSSPNVNWSGIDSVVPEVSIWG